MPISIDGADINDCTIDGQQVQEITIDGEVAWSSGPNIYTGSFDGTLRKWNSNGDQIWSRSFPASPRKVVVDRDGYIYVAVSDDGRVYILNPNGSQDWSYSTEEDPRSIAVHKNGYVYTADDSSFLSGNNLYKLNASNGSLIWDVNHRTPSLAYTSVDIYNNIYTRTTGNNVRKLNSSGDELWVYEHPNNARTIRPTSYGDFVFVCGENPHITRLNSSGGSPSTRDVGFSWGQVGSSAVDYKYLYVVKSTDNELYKLSFSLSLQWTYSGVTNRAVDVDRDGYVYASNGDNLEKISPDGNHVQTFTGHTDTVVSVAVDPGTWNAGHWD